VEQTLGSNAVRFVGELFLPGASQYVSGNIRSGLAHTLLAGAAGAALITSGVAPLIGTLAVVGIKLDSYSKSTTGRGLVNIGADVLHEASERIESFRSTSHATPAEEPVVPPKPAPKPPAAGSVAP
jgi:hypothetical protein